jgi:hypothetical protein
MTLTIQLFKLPLSRNLSRIHLRCRPWQIYTSNKCMKNLDSWRQFTVNPRQCLPEPKTKPTIKENIYTLPNLLTLTRIFSCPILGWSILDGNYHLATGLLFYAGLTDLVGVSSLCCCYDGSLCSFVYQSSMGFWHVGTICLLFLELSSILQQIKL